MPRWLRVIATILVVICAILLALIVRATARHRTHTGGGVEKPRGSLGQRPRLATNPAHVVIDTLNLAHWIHTTAKSRPAISNAIIVDTIDKTAPILRKQFPGRIMYVVKDRESVLNDPATRVAYESAAKRNGVYIYAVERYSDITPGAKKEARHSMQGRDDLYMAILAGRWTNRTARCVVMSEDRFRDFDNFREDVQPFHVYEFSFARALPERDYVRPTALRGLRRPITIRYADTLGTPADFH